MHRTAHLLIRELSSAAFGEHEGHGEEEEHDLAKAIAICYTLESLRNAAGLQIHRVSRPYTDTMRYGLPLAVQKPPHHSHGSLAPGS
jgi:hypothetical protein